MTRDDSTATISAAARPARAAPTLWSDDLAPAGAARRNWHWYHYGALWLGLVVCVPSYMLAGRLMARGMAWPQAMAAVFLGSLAVLAPLLLVGHAGARHGIPFAVLARASFGTRGALLPVLLRAALACLAYGIQTWLGAMMLYTLAGALLGGLTGPAPGDPNADPLGRLLGARPIPGVGINPGELACFLLFWALQLLVVVRGIDGVRALLTVTAPLKIVLCLGLLAWVLLHAGGAGPLLGQPSQFGAGGAKAGQFAAVFWPALAGVAGLWASLAVNIADFTRFAAAPRGQWAGQALGLPVPMVLLAALAATAASATTVAYGRALWDPVDLASRMDGVTLLLALALLLIGTASANLAANLVAPAYAFCAFAPGRISARIGGCLAAGSAIVIMPWKILEASHGYVFTWLGGSAALLAPVLGIVLADYYVLRRGHLKVDALYRDGGAYSYRRGWNPAALLAYAFGVLANVPGFLNAAFPAWFPGVSPLFRQSYPYAWLTGAVLAAFAYGIGMAGTVPRRAAGG